MFRNQPGKIPDAKEADRNFGSREKEKLEEVYESETGSNGEPLAHKAARMFCDQETEEDKEEEYEIPKGSSPGEAAHVIGHIVSMRSDLMPNILDDHINNGQEELAYLYLGKCAMENGDH